MKLSLILFIVSLAHLPSSFVSAQLTSRQMRFEHQFPVMGVVAKLIAYADNRADFDTAVKLAITASNDLESIFSNYSTESECEKLCLSAPHSIPENVSDELFEVLSASQRLNKLTDGAFDPTMGAATFKWRMARKRNRLPSAKTISKAMNFSGWSHLTLDSENKSVAVQIKGLRFDFGGIAKGYAADKVIAIFREQGIDSALVDFGGDIVVGKRPPDSRGWKIKIQSSSTTDQVLLLENCAVATSGDLEQHLTKNNIKYSHIIDPRTGKAIENSCGVTVISETGMVADAVASAICVLGPAAGMRTIKEFPATEVRIECPNGNEIFQTNRFKKFIAE